MERLTSLQIYKLQTYPSQPDGPQGAGGYLCMYAPIFADARRLAGSKLKPPKCVIVPLRKFSEKVPQNILEWINRNIPVWQEFKVLPSAKPLGFDMGPLAGSMNCTELSQKIKARVQSIRNSQAPISIEAYSSNTRVVPVTSYIAQLPIPDSLFKLERAMMHTVWGLHKTCFATMILFLCTLLGVPCSGQ